MTQSFSFTLKVCALLVLPVLIAAGVLLSGPAGFRHGPQSAEAAFLNQVIKLLASDAQANDNFSRGKVAISGDTIVVGAPNEDGGAGDPLSNAGAAYVFQRNEGGADNWGEVTKLTASDAQADDRFGTSVAISGDTIVVGALFEDGGAGDPLNNAGAAYIFQRNLGGADNWGELKKITASDAQAQDRFGTSVAINGNTIVVGADKEDGGVGDPINSAGAAYIFQRDQGGVDNWGEVTKVTASDAQASDGFGRSVAVSGDTAVVGAWLEDGGAGDPLSDAGAAYVFQRNEGGADNWGDVTKLTASDALANAWFGSSVAIDADTVLVGAVRDNAGATEAGAAYVFLRNEGGMDNWGEVKKLTAPVPLSCGYFGSSVAVRSDTIVVGSFRPCGNTGYAYVFERDQDGADNWGQVKEPIASDSVFGDGFGIGVAISGDTIVIGADQQDEAASNAGAAYVFGPPPKQPFKGDTDGDGCPDVNENQAKSEVANGGGRDYKNPWDWYDVNQDGVIDILIDILGVIDHWQPNPGGAPPYNITFDRGPSAGPNPWNMTAPDGVIDLLNDILGVIDQWSPQGCTDPAA